MKKSVLILCVLAAAFWAMPASAEEMGRLYSGIRPLGMGNTFAAVADDKNAAFYNPAGLAYVDEGRLELLTPKAAVSQNTLDFYKDVSDIPANDTTAATTLLNKYVGKHQHLAVDLFPNYTGHGFEIGALAKIAVDADVYLPTILNPVLQSDLKSDVGAILAIGLPFDDGFSAGVTLKFLQRKRFSKVFTTAIIASGNADYTNYTDNIKTSNALGADVGFSYQLDDADWKPRAALVVQNAGDMNFGDYKYSPASPSIPNVYKQQINIGTAITRDIGIGMATFAADYNDLAGNVGTGNDKVMRLHVGAEIKLSYLLAFRAGFNQGYFTFGAGLNFWLIKADYAYYKEEIGTSAGQRDDARHALEVSVGF